MMGTLNLTDFNAVPCSFGNDACVWVFPKLEGVAWNVDNLKFRSSIWRTSDSKPVSLGLKKFFNWEEKPEIQPAPDHIHNQVNCVEKVDGSCLIVSKYKGELITRTRRSLTDKLQNAEELIILKQKYPKAFDNDLLDAEEHSLIYEWVSPVNRIVLKYPEPDLKLINCIRHIDYSYYTQQELDQLATVFGTPRPKYHKFHTLADREVINLLSNVQAMTNEEGLCVYYGNDQKIRKIKSEWYLVRHNFRSNISLKFMVELFLSEGKPEYNDLCTKVLNTFDYECLMEAKPLISEICDAHKQVKNIIEGMKAFLDKIKNLETRKAKAEQIISSYGNTNRAEIVFMLLDNKELDIKHWRKLLFQVLCQK